MMRFFKPNQLTTEQRLFCISVANIALTTLYNAYQMTKQANNAEPKRAPVKERKLSSFKMR
ncbi:MAG: hypothetical protein H0W64_01765 [Gammaproteobacteria bacterium]|nr:hypothetical protein [Gammaproteobacteria bacterium]